MSAKAQIFKNESPDLETDTIFRDTIRLEEVVIGKGQLNAVAAKEFAILRYRVYITYPYAKLAAERLTSLKLGMDKLSSNRDKKKYFKIIEDYLSNEFEAKLKKLSRKQGQILVKLIDRQTGTTTYDLIKDLKSGWKAFWSNSAAYMFDINLKAGYQPYEVNEDYLIETILVRAFESGRLINQTPAKPVNYNDLTSYWEQKASKQVVSPK